MTAPLFTQSLVDTRRDGAGVIIELLRDQSLRVGVIVSWQECGLLGQVSELTPEQTLTLWVDLGLQLLANATPEKLLQLLAAFQSFATARGLRLPPAGEMHAERDREMHAGPDVEGGPPAPAAAEPSPETWENPFA